MKVLVIGSNGQLGYDICRILTNRNVEFLAADIADFDITDRFATHDYINRHRPTAIILCAAYTAVDRAEEEAERCRAVNADGAKNVADAAAEISAKMMYISTDYVFSGTGEHFRQTSEQPAPVSVYGKTKELGERHVRAAVQEHFIVRISWLFGVNGNNFVKTMLRLSETKEELTVVCDQIGSPTYSYDLAKLLCDMIVTDKYGTYHATNEGLCSWAEFASEIMRQGKKSTKIIPIPTNQYPTRAVRPLNSRLSKDCLEQNGFLRLPHWKDALERYLKELGY